MIMMMTIDDDGFPYNGGCGGDGYDDGGGGWQVLDLSRPKP